MSTTRTSETRSARRWLVPGLCVVFAAGYAAVFLAHHRPLLAVTGAGVMLAYGLVLVVFSRRSEAVALLREDAPDERRSMIMTKAAASTLYVLVVLSVGMVFVRLAQGTDPGTWGVVCGVGVPRSSSRSSTSHGAAERPVWAGRAVITVRPLHTGSGLEGLRRRARADQVAVAVGLVDPAHRRPVLVLP
jgi:hypothetical protein